MTTPANKVSALAVHQDRERLGAICLFAVAGDAPNDRIEGLEAAKPCTGLGSRLVDLRCAGADDYGVSLELEATQFGIDQSRALRCIPVPGTRSNRSSSTAVGSSPTEVSSGGRCRSREVVPRYKDLDSLNRMCSGLTIEIQMAHVCQAADLREEDEEAGSYKPNSCIGTGASHRCLACPAHYARTMSARSRR